MKKSTTPKSHKGKIFLSIAVLVLGSAVFFNWYFTNNDITSTLKPLLSNETTTAVDEVSQNLGEASFVDAITPVESEYFTNARLERQKARDSSLDELNKILSNATASEEAKKIAADSINEISKAINDENKIETLVKAKDVTGCIAVINDEKVNVIIDVKELTDAIILQIKEIVMNQTKTSYENISIIESK